MGANESVKDLPVCFHLFALLLVGVGFQLFTFCKYNVIISICSIESGFILFVVDFRQVCNDAVPCTSLKLK